MSNSILIQMLIFLAAAVASVLIFRRLGLGSILGYLIAGIIIGPSALGLIDDVSDILHYSEFGVVLFLFIIGLELDPRRLWTLRKSILGLGLLQVLLSAIVLSILTRWFGFSFSASLIAGMGFALSSTAIGLQIVRERNLLGTGLGQSAFSVLLFQDLAVIPMLAILPLLSQTADSSTTISLWSMSKALIVIVVAVLTVKFSIRWLLRAISSTGVREVFTAFSLLIVIGMAALMGSLGLSMGLGAFIAGVVLADSEYRHALESDIEPFKGLLLGLFFISIGMNIQILDLLQNPTLFLSLLGVTVVAKMLILLAIGRYFSISKTHLPLFGILLSQVGEFGFVLFSAAGQSKVLTSSEVSLFMGVTAFSMLITSFLVFFYDRILEPRLTKKDLPEADIVEDQGGSVIIAGFGRFGQIVGRLLYANGIKSTVLDHDPDTIELLRKFGFKVFYGDATRVDLLEAAGASRAKILVNAIDDVEANLRLIDLVKASFPHLRIVSRARNVQHGYELMDRGVDIWERENFEASLKIGVETLSLLGWSKYEAVVAAQHFRHHNVKLVKELHANRSDEQDLASRIKQGRAELEEQMRIERERATQFNDDWF